MDLLLKWVHNIVLYSTAQYNINFDMTWICFVQNAVTVNHDYIQCHGCRQYFGNENFYRNHACEEPSVNGCCICNIVFENQTDLRTHLSSHTENDFICPNCRKILTNVSYEVHISVCRTVRLLCLFFYINTRTNSYSYMQLSFCVPRSVTPWTI